jgi:phage tail sheath protein FI
LLLSNDELVDVSLVMTSGHGMAVSDYAIDNVAEIRKDCIVFVSPLRASCVNNVGAEVASVKADLSALTRSSYATMDSGWKYMYDRYNDRYVYVPLNGDIAGTCVVADVSNDPWFSPAGYNRGVIKNAVKLAWSPKKSERDTLYSAGINPVVGFPGNGIVLFGDKTLLAKPSAFNRINVRRLFIVLEKAVATAAKFQLFEFNDAFTRAQFRSLVEPFLRDVQGRRGIYDFRVVCDETNNTAEIVDQNEFRADIFVKPAKSINFITLTFVATRTGISFEELGA